MCGEIEISRLYLKNNEDGREILSQSKSNSSESKNLFKIVYKLSGKLLDYNKETGKIIAGHYKDVNSTQS
jgi:DNA-dependent RNA polymerase auxiliary subunit epsilon